MKNEFLKYNMVIYIQKKKITGDFYFEKNY